MCKICLFLHKRCIWHILYLASFAYLSTILLNLILHKSPIYLVHMWSMFINTPSHNNASLTAGINHNSPKYSIVQPIHIIIRGKTRHHMYVDDFVFINVLCPTSFRNWGWHCGQLLINSSRVGNKPAWAKCVGLPFLLALKMDFKNILFSSP